MQCRDNVGPVHIFSLFTIHFMPSLKVNRIATLPGTQLAINNTSFIALSLQYRNDK
ncbi:hypothetical protein OUHCRE2_10730 [Enterobacter asburiae]